MKDEPAFQIDNDSSIRCQLTKREYFAAMAMQGFCSWDVNKGRMLCDSFNRAEHAVSYADALIAELEKK